tara:strand:+ start:1105 stop:1551 length:447 start_codon:yes stop_codon:yes gene_type:complete
MSSKSFVKLLRKIIREEVQGAIRQVLTEQKTNHKQVIEHGMNLSHITEDPMPNKPMAKKQFTKNSMLNDLLNETATTPPTADQAEWSAINFKSEMADAYNVPRSGPLASTGINGETVNMSNQAVASTVNAMTKDYSALMKAIDKKKNR